MPECESSEMQSCLLDNVRKNIVLWVKLLNMTIRCLVPPGSTCLSSERERRGSDERGARSPARPLPDVAAHFHVADASVPLQRWFSSVPLWGGSSRAARFARGAAAPRQRARQCNVCGAAAAAPRASRAGLPLRGSGPDNVWQQDHPQLKNNQMHTNRDRALLIFYN